MSQYLDYTGLSHFKDKIIENIPDEIIQGTTAEINAKIAAGAIDDGDVVVITDDFTPGGGGSSTNVQKLTQAEYNALTTEQKNNGIYVITDAANLDAENVAYADTNVKAELDEINDNLTSLINVQTVTSSSKSVASKGSVILTNGTEYTVPTISGYTLIGATAFSSSGSIFTTFVDGYNYLNIYNNHTSAISVIITIKFIFLRN